MTLVDQIVLDRVVGGVNYPTKPKVLVHKGTDHLWWLPGKSYQITGGYGIAKYSPSGLWVRDISKWTIGKELGEGTRLGVDMLRKNWPAIEAHFGCKLPEEYIPQIVNRKNPKTLCL